MRQGKILLVGHDFAASGGLKKVEGYINKIAYEFAGEVPEVASFLACGSAPLDEEAVAEIFAHVEGSNIILCGMSSSAELAAEEIAVLSEANALIRDAEIADEKPPCKYGLYVDQDTVSGHPWFESVRDKASWLFVPNKDEAAYARRYFTNPKTEIIVSGNIMEEGFAFPPITRERSREKLGLPWSSNAILVPGGKELEVNLAHFGGLVLAIRELPVGLEPHVVLALHPGDQTDGERYKQLKGLGVPLTITAKPDTKSAEYADILMPASEIVPGCDMVVQSASTIGKEAGYQRKPVINFFTKPAVARNPALQSWPPVKRQVEAAVYELGSNSMEDTLAQASHELALMMQSFLTEEGFAYQRSQQEEVYKTPERQGKAVRIIVGTILT